MNIVFFYIILGDQELLGKYAREIGAVLDNYIKSTTPRNDWPAKHPTLIAETLFAIATVLAFLKLCTFYIVNHTIGPVQISFTFSIGNFFYLIIFYQIFFC